MRCTYCEAVIGDYPNNGICPNCGGRLPPRPAGKRCPDCGSYTSGHFCAVCGCSLDAPARPKPAPAAPQVQPVYIPAPHGPLVPGVNCCPKCLSPQVILKKRGFRWGLGIFGFFFVPFIGLLLGFCGSKKLWGKCTTCGHKWKRC